MINCSGIGTFLQGILPYMIHRKEFEYTLIGNHNVLHKYLQENCRIIDTEVAPFSLNELFNFPTSLINTCDCFFSPNYNIPLGIKIPIFATIHDVLFLDIPSLKGYIGRVIRKLAIKRVVNISKQIFTVSEFSKSRIRHHCPEAKEITVCYNGADNIKDINIKETDNILDSSYFLYIGNIKPHKGLNVLLDAFLTIENRCNRKLVIVGNQENFLTADKEISSRLQVLSNNKNIIFTGFVEQDHLQKLIKNAYCLIQPSLYEGFGLPPLEAMHLGTPVILSDIPVFKELYSDFPVIFFKSQNSDSLSDAMLKKHYRVSLTQNQKQKYTYQKSTNIILKGIESHFKL